MPDWLSHPHALSVLAAYGVAVLVLLGLVALTLRDWRRAKTAATQARREP
jgi:heme exporter protein CcmD